MNPLSLLKRSLALRFAKSVDRREHDLALRDPRLAVEHRYAAQRATDYGESGCAYCG
jgi:hypothetical protein